MRWHTPCGACIESKDNFRDQVLCFAFWVLRLELLVGLVASTLTHLSHLSGLTDSG